MKTKAMFAALMMALIGGVSAQDFPSMQAMWAGDIKTAANTPVPGGAVFAGVGAPRAYDQITEEQILKRIRSVELRDQGLSYPVPWFATAENCNRRATMAEIALRVPWTGANLSTPLVISRESAAQLAEKALPKTPALNTVRIILTGPLHIRHGFDLYTPEFSKVLKSYSASNDKHSFWDAHEVVGIYTGQGIKVADLSVSPKSLIDLKDWIKLLVPADVSCKEVGPDEYNSIHFYWAARFQFVVPYPDPDKMCGYQVKPAFGLDAELGQKEKIRALTQDITEGLELLRNDYNGSLSRPEIRQLIGNNDKLLWTVAPSLIDFLPDEMALCREWGNTFKFCGKY